MLSRLCCMVLGPVLAALVAAGGPARAQSNIDAGKTPAQIFADTCNACHRSPRELRPTNAGFLREHYTTGAREAAAMAAYVTSIGSDPRAVQQRRPPVLGAGQAPAAEPRPPAGQAPAAEPRPPQPIPNNDQAKPDAPAALPGAPARRTAQAGDGKPQQASTAAMRPRRPSDSLEATRPWGVLATGALSEPAEAAPASPPPLEPFEE